MGIGLLIGAGSGLASALIFYSAARGGALLSTVLLLLTPLPSLLAGLGWGWLPAIAGAIAGAAAVGIAASAAFAAGYFLVLGLPAALAAYLSYLSRPLAANAARREWYPLGRLLAAIALYAGALPVLLLPLVGGNYDFLHAPAAELFRSLSTRAPELGFGSLSEEQIATLSAHFVTIVPGALAAYWLAIFTLNLYLAGRIVRASGRLARDWPDLPAMAFPPGFALLFALAVAASFASGPIGIAGTGFTGGLMFAYLLAGLALAHFIARRRSPWILWLVYAGLVVFGPYAVLVVAFAGLLDPIFHLKRRFAAPPNQPPT
jgi:hypothetical protein